MSNNNINDDKNNNISSTNNDSIELNTFIKQIGLASTGGQAKVIIRSGNVTLNGTSETRNKKKLFNNDVVEVHGKKYIVKVEKS
jgi:ribosome-associated protein